MKVMVLGATGLTGNLVLTELLNRDWISEVVAPVRRELTANHPRLRQAVVDFEQLEQSTDLFQVDAIVCCLGSTIKKAGSRERFRAIDYGLPLKAAELGRQNGVSAFLLMSAVGASASSPVFYNRVKGELEDALKALAFPVLSIYQPGLLMTERAEQRTAESLGIKAMPAVNALLRGPLSKYRGIESETVARAMVNELASLSGSLPDTSAEVRVHQHDEMQRLAAR